MGGMYNESGLTGEETWADILRALEAAGMIFRTWYQDGTLQHDVMAAYTAHEQAERIGKILAAVRRIKIEGA